MTDQPAAGLISGLPVALEIGPKRRVFAQAVGWPGWCRGARDEARATDALVRYADRYRAAVGSLGAPLGSGPPVPTIVERVTGTATTDFGAPDAVLATDRRLLGPGEPERLVAFLDACWAAFDAALAGQPAEARGVKPESGRSPDRMRVHIAGALRAYLGWLVKGLPSWNEDRGVELEPQLRRIMRDTIGSLPLAVPFETERHPAPYAVRRECWHVLDHAWELLDRVRSA
jgi:hypothetical protein